MEDLEESGMEKVLDSMENGNFVGLECVIGSEMLDSYECNCRTDFLERSKKRKEKEDSTCSNLVRIKSMSITFAYFKEFWKHDIMICL